MFSVRYKKLGLKILYYRRLKGYSQEGLALKAGIARPYLSNIERGEAHCGLDIIFLLADALEIDAAELLKDLK